MLLGLPTFDHDPVVAHPDDGRTAGPTLLFRGDERRDAIEARIQEIYQQSFGARIPAFAPVLVALLDGRQMLAAAGYRPAADHALFLEQYLDEPIEQSIAQHFGVQVARARIVEVGHLASHRIGEGRRLMRWLAWHLRAEGYEWVVGTMTQELRALIARLGVAATVLAPADPSRLAGDARRWGRYYEHQPRVVAIHLDSTLRRRRAAGAVAGGLG